MDAIPFSLVVESESLKVGDNLAVDCGSICGGYTKAERGRSPASGSFGWRRMEEGGGGIAA